MREQQSIASPEEAKYDLIMAAYHLRQEVGVDARDCLLSNPWISATSRWWDDKWVLVNPTPGAPPSGSAIRWNLPLGDESVLTDAQHAGLLDSFRRFVWSLLTDVFGGRHLSPGSLGSVGIAVHRLAWWMVANDYADFSELDAAASEEFLEDLPDLLDDVGMTAGTSTSTGVVPSFPPRKNLMVMHLSSQTTRMNGSKIMKRPATRRVGSASVSGTCYGDKRPSCVKPACRQWRQSRSEASAPANSPVGSVPRCQTTRRLFLMKWLLLSCLPLIASLGLPRTM